VPGRCWGGFSCCLTRTLITAAAEPALASAEPRLRAHVGAGAAGGRCHSLGRCSWDATESPNLVGFKFAACGLSPSPSRIRPQVEDRERRCPFRSKASALLPTLVPWHPGAGLDLALFWGTCGSCQAGFEGLVTSSIGEGGARGTVAARDFLRLACTLGLCMAVLSASAGSCCGSGFAVC